MKDPLAQTILYPDLAYLTLSLPIVLCLAINLALKKLIFTENVAIFHYVLNLNLG